MNKKLIILFVVTAFTLVGCASGSPIDFLIPTPKSPATDVYLDHVQIGKVNWFYHSLSDTKIESKLLNVRRLELQAMYQVAKVSNEAIIEVADPISNAVFGGLIALAGGAGIMIPRPQEKSKIKEALLTDVPSGTNNPKTHAIAVAIVAPTAIGL